jgi:hypothetical protein
MILGIVLVTAGIIVAQVRRSTAAGRAGRRAAEPAVAPEAAEVAEVAEVPTSRQ